MYGVHRKYASSYILNVYHALCAFMFTYHGTNASHTVAATQRSEQTGNDTQCVSKKF